MKRLCHVFFFLFCFTLLQTNKMVLAADLYWDANGSAAGVTDGGNNWQNSSGNRFTTDNAGAGTTVSSWSNSGNSGKSVQFGNNNGAAGTVTIGASTSGNSVSAGTLVLAKPGSGAYTFENNSSTATQTITLNTGGAGVSAGVGLLMNNDVASDVTFQNKSAGGSLGIVLGANQSWVNNSTQAAIVVNAAVSGAFSLTKSGAGKIILDTANSYSGGTTISVGTLEVGSGTALGTGGLSLNGGALAAKGASRTLANNVTVGGDFTLGGSGNSLTLSGTMGLGGATRAITLNNDASLTGIVSNGGLSVSSSSGKILNLDAANTYSAGTTLNSGGLGIGHNSALGTGAVTINGGSIGTMAGSVAKTITNTLVAGGNFTLGVTGGAGTTFNGGLDLGNATRTITMAKDATLGGAISNGTLVLDSANTNSLTLTGTSTHTGGTTIQGSSSLIIGANNALADSGAVTVAGGTLNLGAFSDTVGAVTVTSGGITGSGTLTASSYTMNNASNVVVGAVLAGSGAFNKSGAGVLTLSNANTFTGPVTISAGRLALEVAGALNSNAPVAVNFDSGSTGILDVRANTTVSGLSSSSTGAEVRNTRSGTTRTLTVANNTDQTYDGTLNNGGGTLALQKSGSGILTLNSANGLGGGVTLNEGGIYLGSSQALGSGALTINGGRLAAITSARTLTNAVNLSGDATLGVGAVGGQSLTLSGNINLGNATRSLTLDNSAVFSGQITNGGLTVTSSLGRRLTLSGSNSYAGNTTVNGGTLQVATNGTIASSATTVNSGGILDVDGTAGSVTVNSGGTVEGVGTVSALTVASGGTFAPGNSPGTLNVSGNAVWNGGGHYEWEINNWTGSQGTNWDFLNITGSLTINAATSDFIIDVVSLLSNNDFGDVLNFSESSIYTFAIATAAGGIFDFNADYFTLNTSGFAGLNGSFGGSWAIAQDTNTINLVYTGANYTPPSGATAIPEPSTGGLLFVGLGLVAACRRNKKS